MGRVCLLDCTLRDGGYINNWNFGEDAVRGIIKKLTLTGIDMLELGFLRDVPEIPGVTLFPDTLSAGRLLPRDSEKITCCVMLDVSHPVPFDRINPRSSDTPAAIRVIFKKNRIDEGYEACRIVKARGYDLYVNFVSTDQYTEEELACAVKRFNELDPAGMTIVDTFGRIRRKMFLNYVHILDETMAPGITLCYHAHNNLQQASGNAEALIELGLERDISIDACVYGMGRGAGNLCLELFADHLNETYGTSYRIQPMLEIMDEYLTDIYRRKAWGYALPYYLTASLGCHPNYGTYLAEKGTLTEKMVGEILSSITPEDRLVYSEESADRYYLTYMQSYLDDHETLAELSDIFRGKQVVILAPGRSLNDYREKILAKLSEPDTVCIGVSFYSENWNISYIFSPNMRRFVKIQGKTPAKCIITSNMKEATQKDYIINFSSFASNRKEILDNSGLMLLRLLSAIGTGKVFIAGMDGYSPKHLMHDYFSSDWEFDFSKEAEKRNALISSELREIHRALPFEFLTPTLYTV